LPGIPNAVGAAEEKGGKRREAQKGYPALARMSPAGHGGLRRHPSGDRPMRGQTGSVRTVVT
jgi:hypothetical protein